MVNIQIFKYKVPPFSGEYYHKNSAKCVQGDPCAICGKEVKNPRRYGVIINGGSDWGDANSNEVDSGYMGCYPIGNDCHKKHVL